MSSIFTETIQNFDNIDVFNVLKNYGAIMANGNVAKSEHQKKVETQNKITNLLLVANAGLAVAQSRRIKKLSKTFDKLQNEATKHTEILESINKKLI